MSTCTETTRLTMSPYARDLPPIACHRDPDHIGLHQGIDHVPAVTGDPDGAYDFQRQDRPAFDRLVTWGAGGGSSIALVPDNRLHENCGSCKSIARGGRAYPPDAGHTPEDHRWRDCAHCGIRYHHRGTAPDRHTHLDVADGWCFDCALWYSRAASYAMPGTLAVRVHEDSEAMQPGRIYGWSDVTGAFGGLHVRVVWDDGREVGPRDSLWDGGAIPEEWLSYFPPNARVFKGEKIARAGHTTGFNGLGKPLTYTGHPEV